MSKFLPNFKKNFSFFFSVDSLNCTTEWNYYLIISKATKDMLELSDKITVIFGYIKKFLEYLVFISFFYNHIEWLIDCSQFFKIVCFIFVSFRTLKNINWLISRRKHLRNFTGLFEMMSFKHHRNVVDINRFTNEFKTFHYL